MPSPIGHALGGLLVHVVSARDPAQIADTRRAMLAMAAATAPDLDLLVRFLDGHNHHQGGTHSLFAALVASLVVAGFSHASRRIDYGAVAGFAWGSHLLFDFLARDTSPPIGIPLLWPAPIYFHCPHPIF